jgi:hypothetical protein
MNNTTTDTSAKARAAWRAAIEAHAAHVARIFEYAADHPPEDIGPDEITSAAMVAQGASREARYIIAGNARMSEAVSEVGDSLADAVDGAEAAAFDAWEATA